eukprot:SAG31_NODE_14734_length_790_cov_0.952243_1_plen_109_part_10
MFVPDWVLARMRQRSVQRASVVLMSSLLAVCILWPGLPSHIFLYHHGGMHWSGGSEGPSLQFVLFNWTLYFLGSFGGAFCFFSGASLLLASEIPYVSSCGQRTLYNYCL